MFEIVKKCKISLTSLSHDGKPSKTQNDGALPPSYIEDG